MLGMINYCYFHREDNQADCCHSLRKNLCGNKLLLFHSSHQKYEGIQRNLRQICPILVLLYLHLQIVALWMKVSVNINCQKTILSILAASRLMIVPTRWFAVLPIQPWVLHFYHFILVLLKFFFELLPAIWLPKLKPIIVKLFQSTRSSSKALFK